LKSGWIGFSGKHFMNNIPKRDSLRGFTLVELLVVMGIIAILVSLSVPALSMAMSKARTAKCASNVRGIVAGMITFAGDNNGNLPESGSTIVYGATDGTTGLNGWTQQLEPYLGSAKEDPSGRSIYQCPDRSAVSSNLYYSYFNGAHAAQAEKGGFGAVSLIKIHAPSMHILCGDITANIFSIDDCDKDDYTQDPAFPVNSKIHSGTVNIGFADGHVENLRAFDSSKMTTVYPGLGYNYLATPPSGLGTSP
jgi:prepilin-type N-terminal cleavage/methylation domain-containing protein/prepilin-type processing-associated H-X9-DG protein